jgi:lycopene cyclase domain-containing protein
MLEQFLYLAVLMFSISGLAVLDFQHKLVFFADLRRSLLTIAAGLGIFIVWDILGIGLGIFYYGGSRFSTGVMLLPEFPLEELFFLVLLCYVALILSNGAEKLWPRT